MASAAQSGASVQAKETALKSALFQMRAAIDRYVADKKRYPISLDAFKVERPELLFVKVEDKAQIEGDLVFTEAAK